MASFDRWTPWFRRIASWGCATVSQIQGNESQVRQIRFGQLELAHGELVCLRARWWPMIASEWKALVDQHLRNLPDDTCYLYYAFYRSNPGFMTLNYAHSGARSTYATIRQATKLVDQIAEIWNAQAIVCHVVNARTTQRLMSRWGYVQHAQRIGPNHYIKRLKKSHASVVSPAIG